MVRCTPEDVDLFKAHQSLIDHLFEKSPVDGLCNLAFYRGLAKENVAGDFLEEVHGLSREPQTTLGIRGDWNSRFTYTFGAILPNVRKMKEYGSLGDRICEAYTRLVLDHENDPNCNEIMQWLRSKGFANVPSDGTCS